MSDTAPAAEATTETDTAAQAAADQQPAEKAEPDWKAEARKHEARSKEWQQKAKANEDAARRLKEIEDANKSDLEKAAARAEAAEAKAKELELHALRLEVAAAKKVPADLLTGSTQEELEAAADKLIAFQGSKAPVGAHLPNQDKSPNAQSSELVETARKLFGGQ